MRNARIPFAGLVVLLLLAGVVGTAVADVIHLRTGEAVKGRPVQERSNEKYLTVEDYLTGSFRRFAWEAVDVADRNRLHALWRWETTGQTTVEGVLIEYRLGDGSTTEIRGVVEKETDSTVHLQRDGKILEIPKARIVSQDPEELDVREVWSPAQLIDRQKEAMKAEGVDFENLSARDHWRIGTYAEWVEGYETAREHYTAAAADEDFLKKDLAKQRLGRVEALLRDRAALDALQDVRFKLRMNLFRKVRTMLDAFGEKHPEASEAVLQKLASIRADFDERRTMVLQREARRHFVDIVKDLIHDKIREKDVAITDVTTWTRRELPEEAFARLSGRVLARFDDVTPEEAELFWEGRDKGQWKRVTYGGGTFIVDPPKIKPPKARRGRGGQRGGGGGGLQPPKPPTRDQWWEKASTREREQWVLAYFIERSELFALGEREYRPCSMCHGVGLLSKTVHTGDVWTYLCTRCGGAQHDVIVKYR